MGINVSCGASDSKAGEDLRRTIHFWGTRAGQGTRFPIDRPCLIKNAPDPESYKISDRREYLNAVQDIIDCSTVTVIKGNNDISNTSFERQRKNIRVRYYEDQDDAEVGTHIDPNAPNKPSGIYKMNVFRNNGQDVSNYLGFHIGWKKTENRTEDKEGEVVESLYWSNLGHKANEWVVPVLICMHVFVKDGIIKKRCYEANLFGEDLTFLKNDASDIDTSELEFRRMWNFPANQTIKIKFGSGNVKTVEPIEPKKGGNVKTAEPKKGGNNRLAERLSRPTIERGDDLFKVGERIDVYSSSRNCWCPGVVYEVHQSVHKVVVQYKVPSGEINQKTIRMSSKNLRPMTLSLHAESLES